MWERDCLYSVWLGIGEYLNVLSINQSRTDVIEAIQAKYPKLRKLVCIRCEYVEKTAINELRELGEIAVDMEVS